MDPSSQKLRRGKRGGRSGQEWTKNNLHKKLSAAMTPNEKTVLQRQIDSTDEQIDRLVYELYGLTLRRTRLCRAGCGGD